MLPSLLLAFDACGAFADFGFIATGGFETAVDPPRSDGGVKYLDIDI